VINVSQGGRPYLPNGIDLTTIDNQRDPGRIAYSLKKRATRRPRRLLMAPVKPGFRPAASVHQSRPMVPWRHAKQHTGFRCAPALAALNQGVGNEAVSIDSARQPMALAVDRAHDLVEMPLVAELRGAPTDLAGAGPAHCLRPAPHGFVAGSWLTTIPRRQQVLDHPQAERKTDKEPDSLLDDVRQ
jgi:hypothetical protein